MSTPRARLVQAVADALGNRRLLWAGLRAADAESLCDIAQFDSAFSIIGHLDRATTQSLAYEDLTSMRPDLDAWSIDDHLADPPTVEFRRRLLGALSVESALVPYRPSEFLSAVAFARQDRCLYLGQFGGLQAAFEHKPWVESELRRRGVPGVEWSYIADEDQLLTRTLLDAGPIVLRRSRTSGGEGLYLVTAREEVEALWPRHSEGFVSVSTYIADVTPLNIGATVWSSGQISLHMPSVQLIGIPSCVERPFGYCGNDFSLAKQLTVDSLGALEAMTTEVGRWLHEHGYIGTFGVDALLLPSGEMLFLEVNPRFQGSTRCSSRLSSDLELPCLPLEHVAAQLMLDPVAVPSLQEQVDSAPALGTLAIHRRQESAAGTWPSIVEALRTAGVRAQIDSEAPPSVHLNAGALAARLTVEAPLTTTGFDLLDPYASLIDNWQHDSRTEVDALA